MLTHCTEAYKHTHTRTHASYLLLLIVQLALEEWLQLAVQTLGVSLQHLIARTLRAPTGYN